MAVKPILYNTPMVQAIEEGRKTVTRRRPFQMPNDYNELKGLYRDDKNRLCAVFRCSKDLTTQAVYAPRQPGDILWVRETWTKLWYVDPDGYTHYDQPMYYYAADGTPDITLLDGDGFEQDDQRVRWRPSIHMPKEAARLFLLVKAVRVERLQEITEEQAVLEGAATLFLPSHRHREKKSKWVSGHCSECKHFDLLRGLAIGPCSGCYEGQKPHDGTSIGCTFGFELKPDTSLEPATIRFRYLWNSTDPKGGCYWSDNPWVWVIEFERCDRPAGFLGGPL